MAIDASILDGIESRIRKAEQRYGPVASTHEGLGVALEEWDELREAIKSNDPLRIDQEALDLAAVLVRMVIELRTNDKTKNRSRK